MKRSKEFYLSVLKNHGLDGSDEFRYQMLDRMRQDCNYYLSLKGRRQKSLWTGNELLQITIMRALYYTFKEKPEWISSKEISDLKAKMLRRMETSVGRYSLVNVYSTCERDGLLYCSGNVIQGFIGTLSEARKFAKDTEKVNGNRIRVAVVDEVNTTGTITVKNMLVLTI